jgi:hypothetical protein
VIEIPPRVVNALRDGIVIGRTGRDENVQKIRPLPVEALARATTGS